MVSHNLTLIAAGGKLARDESLFAFMDFRGWFAACHFQ